MKLLFLVAEDSYFCSHRLNLAMDAKASGFEVAVATRCQTQSPYLEKIRKAGIQVFPLKHFKRSKLNPFSQILSLQELIQIYRVFKPTLVHHVAMKPVVLGSVVAAWCKVPYIVNALGGLGYLFIESQNEPLKDLPNNLSLQKKALPRLVLYKKQFLKKMVSIVLGKIHAKSNCRLILQNPDDIDTLLKVTKIDPRKISLIRGAGVDISAFPVVSFPPQPPVIIACVSRMLWDKGIGELIQAVTDIQQKRLPIQVMLYGMPDPENPASISTQQLQSWHDNGLVDWRGHCEDVATAYANCHIAVLPSYREGLPKSLLEAASCGRPIIATDVPGCREIVRQGKNGLLVPPQDAASLVEAIINLATDQILQKKMGEKGRQIVETDFSDKLIHRQTIELYRCLMGLK